MAIPVPWLHIAAKSVFADNVQTEVNAEVLLLSKRYWTCILALPHWEGACQAEPAPSEMKLRDKLQLWR